MLLLSLNVTDVETLGSKSYKSFSLNMLKISLGKLSGARCW